MNNEVNNIPLGLAFLFTNAGCSVQNPYLYLH